MTDGPNVKRQGGFSGSSGDRPGIVPARRPAPSALWSCRRCWTTRPAARGRGRSARSRGCPHRLEERRGDGGVVHAVAGRRSSQPTQRRSPGPDHFVWLERENAGTARVANRAADRGPGVVAARVGPGLSDLWVWDPNEVIRDSGPRCVGCEERRPATACTTPPSPRRSSRRCGQPRDRATRARRRAGRRGCPPPPATPQRSELAAPRHVRRPAGNRGPIAGPRRDRRSICATESSPALDVGPVGLILAQSRWRRSGRDSWG